MVVQPNSKLLMMGASITDSERVRPVGEGHPGSLMKGYVSFMDAYGAAARQIAQKHQAIFVDTEAAFDAVLTQLHPMVLALDRIHPTHVRHIVITWAFLNAAVMSGTRAALLSGLGNEFQPQTLTRQTTTLQGD